MNLFRSEEHIRTLPQFDPATAGGIVSLPDVVALFSKPLFQKRREPDYVSQCPKYAQEFMAAAANLGPFWNPKGQ